MSHDENNENFYKKVASIIGVYVIIKIIYILSSAAMTLMEVNDKLFSLMDTRRENWRKKEFFGAPRLKNI